METLATGTDIKKKVSKRKPPAKRNGKGDKKHPKAKRDTKNDTKKIKILKRGVASIEFDATARYEHLTGFSERKRARRAYGLAQQKVKDRKSKLEHRAAIRTAERDFITEAEQLKQEHYQLQQQQQQQEKEDGQQHGVSILIPMKDNDNDDNDEQTAGGTTQVLFDSKETEQQWGGHVVVTTSTHIPGDSDNDDDDVNHLDNSPPSKRTHHGPNNHDTEQEYAGNIEKYIKTIRGNLPSKRKRTTTTSALSATTATSSSSSKKSRTKGQHGAMNMKGIGSAADMKVAQKMLSRSTSKITKGSMNGKKSRKR